MPGKIVPARAKLAFSILEIGARAVPTNAVAAKAVPTNAVPGIVVPARAKSAFPMCWR